MRRTILLVVIGLVLEVPRLLAAADTQKSLKPLRFSVKSIVPRARSHAPQMIEVGLDCDSDKLFEGRLELKWYLGKRLVHEFLSHELAVTAGGQRLRVTLPPIIVHSDKTPVTAYARFHAARQIIDLGEVDLVVPVNSKRAFVVALVQPHEMAGLHKERTVLDAFGLEQFNPRPEAHFDLLSFPARLTPEELPTIAAGYASIDLLVLDGEGFQQVRAAQLSAIAHWVAGGGSVIVVPHGILTARHVAFLNRLTGWHKNREAYALDERGQLVIGEMPPSGGKKLATYQTGLGRAVVVHEALDPQVDFESADWKAAVAFLWKARAAQIETILRTGGWDFSPPPTPYVYLTPRPFAPQPNDVGSSIRQFLMPDRIEGVPLSMVAVILSLFLLAVAPGDYFLLGRLNCRKYTWWLFALVSASFTLCTVKVAESYMGHVDYRTSLTFVDLETAGGDTVPIVRAARNGRFELLFVATQRTIETALRNCLYADLTERGTSQEELQFGRTRFSQFEEGEVDETEAVSVDLPMYEGALPGSFTVRQQLRQWSPRITRQTTFGGDRDALEETQIDWNSLSTAELNSAEGRQAFFAAVLAREPQAHVLLLNGRRAYDAAHVEGVLTDGTADAVRGAVSWTPPLAMGTPATVVSIAKLKSAAPILVLAVNVSVRPASGLFAIVAQISPTGNANLEDLALLDQSDPRQWLFIAAVHRESDWIVYRQLFHAASSAGEP